MPILCNVALGKQAVFEICGDDYDTPDGSCVRDYVHVSDIADGHIKAMEYIDNIHGTRVYNLGNGKPVSVFELVKTFERVNHLQLPSRVTVRRPGDAPISYAFVSGRKESLADCQKTLEEMCIDSLECGKKTYL